MSHEEDFFEDEFYEDDGLVDGDFEDRLAALEDGLAEDQRAEEEITAEIRFFQARTGIALDATAAQQMGELLDEFDIGPGQAYEALTAGDDFDRGELTHECFERLAREWWARDTGRAMSQENVDVVRQCVDAFKRRDVPAAVAAFSPDIEWRTPADEPDPQTFRGYDGLVALLDVWSQIWEDSFFEAAEPEEYIDAGDFVVVPIRASVRGKQSGVEVEIFETFAFRLAQGKITEVRECRTKAQALEAAGLSD